MAGKGILGSLGGLEGRPIVWVQASSTDVTGKTEWTY